MKSSPIQPRLRCGQAQSYECMLKYSQWFLLFGILQNLTLWHNIIIVVSFVSGYKCKQEYIMGREKVFSDTEVFFQIPYRSSKMQYRPSLCTIWSLYFSVHPTTIENKISVMKTCHCSPTSSPGSHWQMVTRLYSLTLCVPCSGCCTTCEQIMFSA